MGKRARICNTGVMPVKKDVGNLPSGKRTSSEQENGWIDRARKKRSVECRFMWQLCEKLKTLALHDQTKESPKRLNFSLTCSLSPSSCWFFFPNFRTSQFVAVLLFSECTQKVFSWDKSTFFQYHSFSPLSLSLCSFFPKMLFFRLLVWHMFMHSSKSHTH